MGGFNDVVFLSTVAKSADFDDDDDADATFGMNASTLVDDDDANTKAVVAVNVVVNFMTI